MPATTRAFLKSGMIYFICSLIIGVVIEFRPELSTMLSPLFWHMLMVGWITQIIMGVSLWMFPGRSKTEDLRSQFLSWFVFLTLNLGLILRFSIEPFYTGEMNLLQQTGLIASAVLQPLAGIGYLIEIWPRVLSKEQSILMRKAKKKRIRDATD